MQKLAAATTAALAALYFVNAQPPEAHPATSPALGLDPGDEGADGADPSDGGTVTTGSGPLGLVGSEVAVALERPLAPLPLQAGDVVELVAVVADDHRGASAIRVDRARVVALDERSVTVAVATASALSLIEYRAIGTIEMILTPAAP